MQAVEEAGQRHELQCCEECYRLAICRIEKHGQNRRAHVPITEQVVWRKSVVQRATVYVAGCRWQQCDNFKQVSWWDIFLVINRHVVYVIPYMPSNYLTVSAIKCVPVGYGLVLCRLALHTQDKMHNITKTAKFYFTSTGSRSVTSGITKAVKSSGLSSFSALIFSLVGEWMYIYSKLNGNLDLLLLIEYRSYNDHSVTKWVTSISMPTFSSDMTWVIWLRVNRSTTQCTISVSVLSLASKENGHQSLDPRSSRKDVAYYIVAQTQKYVPLNRKLTVNWPTGVE